MPNPQIRLEQHPHSSQFSLIATFDQSSFLERAFIEKVICEAARLMAEQIVADKFQEVMAAIDVQAIANLAVAEAAAEISKTLKADIPRRVVEIERTKREVYQRGVFGGVKRIS